MWTVLKKELFVPKNAQKRAFCTQKRTVFALKKTQKRVFCREQQAFCRQKRLKTSLCLYSCSFIIAALLLLLYSCSCSLFLLLYSSSFIRAPLILLLYYCSCSFIIAPLFLLLLILVLLAPFFLLRFPNNAIAFLLIIPYLSSMRGRHGSFVPLVESTLYAFSEGLETVTPWEVKLVLPLGWCRAATLVSH